MKNILAFLEKRNNDNWLCGCDRKQLLELARQSWQELASLADGDKRPNILLAESDPVRFLSSFIAAIAAECPVFLGNPGWAKEEWQQAMDLVQAGELSLSKGPLIMIPTGGTSGKIRFAVHTWDTLMASVQGFAEYFQISQVNSCCVLPLYHVSGLMQFMRSFTTGGKLAILPSYKFLGDIADEINPAEFFISLVPTQLHRLLQDGQTANWLSRFKAILLGGAPAWPELLAEARGKGLPLAPTYGMTETASQVATLKPEEFLAGNNSCGGVLPHAQIKIRKPFAGEGLAGEGLAGEVLAANQTGIVTIEARSLALGYYPLLDAETLTNDWGKITDDLGFLDERGYLNIVGRRSHKIVTGGENVFPAEVEAAILATGLVSDICVIGISDRDWGQIVTAVYVPSRPDVSPEFLGNALADKLAKYKQPKYWLPGASLPRNAQGKVNRERLQELVKQFFPLKDGIKNF